MAGRPSAQQLVELEQRIAGLKTEIESKQKEYRNGGMEDVPGSPAALQSRLKVLDCQRTLTCHRSKVMAVSWASNSEMIASVSQDGRLVLWNAFADALRPALALKSQWVMTVCLDKREEPRLAAYGGVDNVCSLYDLESGSVLRELSSHDGYLSCCRFLHDETQILTSSGDSTCILWDVERSIPIVHFNDHSGDVMSVSLRPGDDDCFISGSSDGTVKVWDVRLDKATATYGCHESDVTGVAFHSGSHAFASSCDDAACRLFDLRAIDVLNVFTTPKVVCGISSVELSASGRLLFGGYHNNDVLVWDTLRPGDKPTALIGALGDASITVAEAKKRQPRVNLRSSSTVLPALEAGSVLPTPSTATRDTHRRHVDRVSCLALAPNGTALASGSWDSTVLVWA